MRPAKLHNTGKIPPLRKCAKQSDANCFVAIQKPEDGDNADNSAENTIQGHTSERIVEKHYETIIINSRVCTSMSHRSCFVCSCIQTEEVKQKEELNDTKRQASREYFSPIIPAQTQCNVLWDIQAHTKTK
jgi:hypothetical protein